MRRESPPAPPMAVPVRGRSEPRHVLRGPIVYLPRGFQPKLASPISVLGALSYSSGARRPRIVG